MIFDPDREFDPLDFHSDEECGAAPSRQHKKIREALAACGVPHPCCATSWSIGYQRDEDGAPIPDSPTELVVFYGHRHLRITPEQEFVLVNAMAEAKAPKRILDE